MNNEAKFIFVKDEATKDQLEKSGFRLFRKEANRWVFLNDTNKTFNKTNGVVYSNTLTF